MASINLIKASDGTGNASTATVQTVRNSGVTTIIVDTVNNIPATFMGSMGTPHTFVDPVTSEEITVISEATAVDFTGHVSGANLEIDSIAPGYTDLGSAVSDIVVIRPTTEWANNIATTFAVAHNDDGTLKADVVTTAKIADDNVTTAKVVASGCNLSASAAQSIANNTAAAIGWDTEAYDTASYHDTVTNNSRITVPTAGKYVFTTTITFDANSAGSRLVWFIKNGTTAERYGYDGKNAVTSPLTSPITTSVTLNLAATDYVQVYVYQSSGGALNITSDAQEIGSSKFTCTRLGS